MLRTKFPPRRTKYYQLARRLMKVVAQRTTINHSTHTQSWATEIKLLCTRELTDDPNPTKRVHRALIFLEKLYKGRTSIPKEYHVIIESGSALRRKFAQVEGAIERETNGYGNGNGRTRDRREPIERDSQGGRWFRHNVVGKPQGWIHSETEEVRYQERYPSQL